VRNSFERTHDGTGREGGEGEEETGGASRRRFIGRGRPLVVVDVSVGDEDEGASVIFRSLDSCLLPFSLVNFVLILFFWFF
jgi:hypothetical protein